MRPNDVCPILRTHPSQSPYLYTYRSIEPSLFVLLNIECFGLVCCEHPIQDALGPYILTGTPEILLIITILWYQLCREGDGTICVCIIASVFFRFWDSKPGIRTLVQPHTSYVVERGHHH